MDVYALSLHRTDKKTQQFYWIFKDNSSIRSTKTRSNLKLVYIYCLDNLKKSEASCVAA